MKKEKPFRIETVRIGKSAVEIWEINREQRFVCIVKISKDIQETQGFDSLSGARSWGYFRLLTINGAKRI